MRVYILKDDDFEKLLAEISKDPKHGIDGGSGVVLSDVEQKAHDDAHSFYNYLIRRWIDRVTGKEQG
jgi:hypothetical protein